MGKRVKILPVKTVTFEVCNETGDIEKVIDFTFNNYALATLTEQFGDINKLFKDMQSKPYDLVAVLLYCGVVNNDTEFTLEDARTLVAGGGGYVLEEVSDLVTESLLSLGGDDVKKKFMESMSKKYQNYR